MARRTAKPVTKGAKKTARSKAGKRPATTKRIAAKKKPAAKKRTAAARPARATGGATTAMRALAQHIIDVSLSHDDEAILALYAEDVESIEARQPAAVGIEALRAKFAGWRSMTTDNVFEPRRVVVDGNVIVIEWVGRVTLAASGRQAELHEVAVHEIRNGKIAREAFFYNPAALAG
jgi:ketosteroid isomerase-like protein